MQLFNYSFTDQRDPFIYCKNKQNKQTNIAAETL